MMKIKSSNEFRTHANVKRYNHSCGADLKSPVLSNWLLTFDLVIRINRGHHGSSTPSIRHRCGIPQWPPQWLVSLVWGLASSRSSIVWGWLHGEFQHGLNLFAITWRISARDEILASRPKSTENQNGIKDTNWENGYITSLAIKPFASAQFSSFWDSGSL